MKQGEEKQREHTIPLTGYAFNGDKEIYYPPGGATISIQKQKVSNKLKITLCCICLLITVSIIGLAFLLFLKVQSNMNTAQSEFCLPCDRLDSKIVPTGTKKGTGSLSVRLVERSGTKIQLCCGKEELFNNMLDNFLTDERKHNPSDPSAVRGPPPDSVMAKFPVAHLTLNKKYDVRADKDSLFSVHGWTLQKSRFAIKQCPYQGGRLIITQPGLYYVYSQVHFIEKPSEDSSTFRAQSLSHYIYKYNKYLSNGGYRAVLQSSASRCKSETGSVEHSSYLGAVLRLYQDDEMFVKVNNLTSLHADPLSTYFGLYYISPLPKS